MVTNIKLLQMQVKEELNKPTSATSSKDNPKDSKLLDTLTALTEGDLKKMAGLKGDCIFVIDPNTPIRQFLGGILSEVANVLGFSTLYAAEQAISSGIIPKLITLEIDSPDYDGSQIFEMLKRYKLSEKVDVIVVTNDQGDAVKSGWLYDKRISFYLTKPFNPVLLIDQVEKHFVQDKRRKFAFLDEFGLDDLKKKRLFILVKRAIDIFISTIILLLLAPVMLSIAIVVKIDSKGPVLYASPRAGKGYRIFKFYKFRTMVQSAATNISELVHLNQYTGRSLPVFFKLDNDPRVSRVGRFLRNTSLDELPQLMNVLLGDMSLVGNRPLPLYEACTLTEDDSVKRFLAPSGITGLWQIRKRGSPHMSVEERISIDVDYAANFGFWCDFRIALKTLPVLLHKEKDI